MPLKKSSFSLIAASLYFVSSQAYGMHCEAQIVTKAGPQRGQKTIKLWAAKKFEALDRASTGYLEAEEIKVFMMEISNLLQTKKPPEEMVLKILSKHDTDGDERLSVEKLENFLQDYLEALLIQCACEKFLKIDREGNAYLALAEGMDCSEAFSKALMSPLISHLISRAGVTHQYIKNYATFILCAKLNNEPAGQI